MKRLITCLALLAAVAQAQDKQPLARFTSINASGKGTVSLALRNSALPDYTIYNTTIYGSTNLRCWYQLYTATSKAQMGVTLTNRPVAEFYRFETRIKHK